MSEEGGKSIERVNTKAVGIVGLAVMCSRVLGLAREVILGGLYGTDRNMDVFVTAFRAPNLLRDLFAEGALSTAFITVFSKKIKTEGDASAWQLANKFATLLVVFMSVVTLLGVVFTPQLVGILATGFSPDKAADTVMLTRIMFPFILLVSLAALAMGMLNSKNVFGAPAMASSFFNLGSIIGGVGLAYWLDPTFGPRSLIGLAVGTLIGGLLQLVVQFPALRRVGFHFRPDFRWRDSGVREILFLMGPAVIAASAVQVNVLVNNRFASELGDGAISSLSYAFRLMQLPLGIFGVAIATVTLPLVSRFASGNDWVGIRSALGRGMRLAFLLTIPSTVGLVLLAEPIISLIFQRGNFNADSLRTTSEALRFYALGLAAYSGIKVVAPAFYAIGRRNFPMMVSFFSIALNFGLNLFLTFQLGMGIRGLAFSTSLVALVNFTILYVAMRRHTTRLETRALGATLGKVVLASLPLAAICIGSQAWLFGDLGGMPFYTKLVAVLGVIGAGGVAFFGSVLLLKVEEVGEIVAVVRRKLKR